MKNKLLLEIVGIIGIVCLAAFFRLYDIKQYPAGLSSEEAANGEDALLILDGDWKAFYPRSNGREGLFFYIEALSIQTFGIGVWQLHLASAGVGILTVLAMYFATRPYFGKLSALVTSTLLATSHWHVTLSRSGFRVILIPLFVAAFTAFVGYTITSVKNKRTVASYIYAALAGVTFAGGLYATAAYSVMIGVVLGILLILLLAALHPKIGFPHVRRYGVHAIIAVVIGVLTVLPLGIHFVQHPQDIIGSAGESSIFNTDLQQTYGNGTLAGALWYSTRETLKSFVTGRGDASWLHSVAGYPLLSPLVAILFLVGLLWTFAGVYQVARSIVKGKEVHLGMVYSYILLLIVGMLVPVITTVRDIPNGLRSIGLIVPLFMLAGTAGAVMYRWAARNLSGGLRAGATGVLIGLVVLNGLYGALLYFGIAMFDSGAAYAYRSDLTGVSDYINDYKRNNPEATRPYVVLDSSSIQTVHFLTHSAIGGRVVPKPHDFQDHSDEAEHAYTYVKPADAYLTALQKDEIIIFTQSTLSDADVYEETYGNAIELVESRRNEWDQEVMRVYKGVMPGVAPEVPVIDSSLDA